MKGNAVTVVLLISQMFLYACQEQSSRIDETQKLPPELELRNPDLGALSTSVADMGKNLLESIAQQERQNPNQEELAKSYGSLGLFYLSQEFLNPSAAAFNKAIRLWPSSFEYWYLAAQVDKLSGNGEDAIVKMLEATRLNDHYLPAKTSLADLYLESGEPDQAKLIYAEVLEDSPSHWPALLGMSQVLLNSDDAQSAIVFLEKAYPQYPSSQMVSQLLGDAYRRLKQPEKAQQYLRQEDLGRIQYPDSLLDLMENWKDPARISLLAGDRHYVMGNFLAAEKEYLRAIDLDRNNGSVWNNLALAVLKTKGADLAQEKLLEGLAANPGNSLLGLSLAKMKYLDYDFEASEDILNELLSDNPEMQEARMLLAKSLVRLERWKSAESELLNLKRASFSPNEVSKYLLKCLARQQKWTEVFPLLGAHLDQYKDSDDDFKKLRSRYLMLSPVSDQDQRQKGRRLAKELYEMEKSPENTVLYSMVLSQEGRPLEGSEVLSQLLRALESESPNFETETIELLRDSFSRGMQPQVPWEGYPFPF